MTEANDVDTLTTIGRPSSGNVNNAHGSTTPSQTDTSASTATKYEGNNKDDGKGNNNKKQRKYFPFRERFF